MTEIHSPSDAKRRHTRSDALANCEKLLEAAAQAVRTRGEKVPMLEISELAGVGVGTLYRHFPTREALLSTLTERSLLGVLQRVRGAAERAGSAIQALERFFEETIKHRDELILPYHGGPAVLDARGQLLEREIRDAIEEILARGRDDGSIRVDATATDVIIAGAQLSQPLPHVAPWDQLARRQARVYLAGLRAVDDDPMPFSRAARAPQSPRSHVATPTSDRGAARRHRRE